MRNIPPETRFDFAVVGAGVVGCAVARKMTLLGAKVVVVERGDDLLSGTSKANSALLHTGFDAPPRSLERRLMQEGHAEYLAIRGGLNLPLLETGAMVAAWTDEELLRLPAIAAQARENDVPDIVLLDRSEALTREPGLASHIKGALFVPREHVIDAWSSPLGYLTEAVANGAAFLRATEVTGGAFDGEAWTLDTDRARVRASHLVNCAGLFGDRLELMLLGDASFTIRPRKGQFVVFDKTAARLLTTTLLPVPTERTKGVVLARTIYGNLLVGPTAEEQEDRTRATVDRDALEALVARAIELLPALAGMPVTAVYAGLRPASESKDYQIRHVPERHWLTLGGIRSTGLTAALGLASHAAKLLAAGDWRPSPLATPRGIAVPTIAEHGARDWQQPGYDEVVCHCEMVTGREIAAAFASLVPPGDFGGLKRRTRAAMGRCQGFYCGARLAELTEGRFAAPLAAGSST